MPAFHRILTSLLFLFPLWIFILEHFSYGNHWGITFLIAALFYRFRSYIWSNILICLLALMIFGLIFIYLPTVKLERLYPFSVSAAMLGFFVLNHRNKNIGPLEKVTMGFFRFVLRYKKQMAFLWRFLPKGLKAKIHGRDTDNLSTEETRILHSIMPIWVVGLSINTTILFLFLFFFPTSWWVYYSCGISYVLLACLMLISINYGRKYHSTVQ